MKTIIGDILDVVTERGGILVHQVNCQRVAGAGLALQIRQRWPAWYEFYRQSPSLLGSVSLFRVEPAAIVASLYAQDRYGSRNTVQTDYMAFDKALSRLTWYVGSMKTPPSIYFPHGIGCGLAGGFWPSVLWLIQSRFPDATVVQFPETMIADSNLLLDNIAK